MKTFKDFLLQQEEYAASIRPKYNKNAYYEIFKNPNKSEINDLKNDSVLVRFIADGGDIYVFSAELLHDLALKELGLKRKSTMFEGVAKISNGKLQFHVTNQNYSDLERQVKLNPVLSLYFN